MKFGAHCYLFVDRWSDDALFALDACNTLGLDCVEIAVGDDVEFTPAVTRRRAEFLGLDLIVSPGGHWPLEADLSSPRASERRLGLTWHQTQIDLANELGAVAYCGALYGHAGTVRKNGPDAEEQQRVADGLYELAEYGAACGVSIVLEPMSHFRTHVVNTPMQAKRLIELVDHSNLFVLLDTYHLITEITDFAAGIRTVAQRLWGLHACENNRGVPGRGIVPWNDVFDALEVSRFDGYVLLETYNSSIGDFALSRGMFHDVCPEPHRFVVEGRNFLKRGLAASRPS